MQRADMDVETLSGSHESCNRRYHYQEVGTGALCGQLLPTVPTSQPPTSNIDAFCVLCLATSVAY